MPTTLRIPLSAALAASLVVGCGNAASTSATPPNDTARTSTRTESGARPGVTPTSEGPGAPTPGKIPGLDGGPTGDAGAGDSSTSGDAARPTTGGVWRE